MRRDEQGTLPVWFVRTERENGWSQFFPGPKGAMREFTSVSAPGEWPLVLGGHALLGDGRAARFRLTMTREGAEGSRRLLEMSVDGGAKWQTIFDYHYRRPGR